MVPFALALLVALQEPPEDITKLVQALRSEAPAKREEAARKIRALGRAAVPELEKALKDTDPEVAGRARDLLAAIEKDERERREARASEELKACLARIGEAKALEDPKAKAAKYEEALASARRIASEGKGTKVYGMGLFNVGVILQDFLGRPEEAIGEFQKVIDSDVDDRDESGMLMSPYRNYRYHARRMMSAGYEKLGRPGLALEMAYRMREAYVSHCGTCIAGMERVFVQRVEELCGKPEESDAEVVKAARGAAKGADQLLLELGRRYREKKLPAPSKWALHALVQDLPKSPLAVDAARLLQEPDPK